jgi:predicted DCC family thiol-disulfide oxidoreductase YuxK
MEESLNIGGRLLVVFDGHCGLCNGSVRWLLRRDGWDRLRFVAMESALVGGVLERHSLSGLDSATGTMLVVRDPGGAAEKVLVRSDAVVALLRELPRPWSGVGAAMKWIPRPLRDLGYRLVARWRYRIRGRMDICPVPTVEERKRFL